MKSIIAILLLSTFALAADTAPQKPTLNEKQMYQAKALQARGMAAQLAQATVKQLQELLNTATKEEAAALADAKAAQSEYEELSKSACGDGQQLDLGKPTKGDGPKCVSK